MDREPRPFFSDDTLYHVEHCERSIDDCEECRHYIEAIGAHERRREAK